MKGNHFKRLAAVLLTVACFPVAAGDWFFVGISRLKMGSDRECPRYELVAEEVDSEQHAKAFALALLKDESRVDKSVNVYGPGHVVIVYKYQGRSPVYRNCPSFLRYSFASGHSEQRARAGMESNSVTYKENYVGPPEPLRIWGVAKDIDEKVTIDDLGGVRIRYLVRKGEGGKTGVVAKVQNRSELLARITFKVDGGGDYTMELAPNQDGTQVLGTRVDTFRVEAQFSEQSADPQRPLIERAIQAGKALMREYVTHKDGKIESRPTALGVRG